MITELNKTELIILVQALDAYKGPPFVSGSKLKRAEKADLEEHYRKIARDLRESFYVELKNTIL